MAFNDGWHLDKKVNISHIVATILLAGTLLGVWSRTNDRITIIEQKIVAQEAQIVLDRASLRNALLDIKQEIRDLRRSVDTVRDNQLKSIKGPSDDHPRV